MQFWTAWHVNMSDETGKVREGHPKKERTQMITRNEILQKLLTIHAFLSFLLYIKLLLYQFICLPIGALRKLK